MKITHLKILSFILIELFSLELLKEFIVDKNVTLEFYLLWISFSTVFFYLSFIRKLEGPFLTISLTSIILFIIGARNYALLGIFIAGVPFYFYTENINKLRYSVISILFLAIMAIAGTLRIGSASGMYVFSIYDDIPSIYVPIIFKYGLIVTIGRIILTISPQSLVIMGLASYFAVENTYLIIKKFGSINSTGILQVVPAVVSCQCETTLSLSALTATIFSLIILPIVLISIFFLIMTNLLLKNKIKLRIFNKHREELYLFIFLIFIGILMWFLLSFSILFYVMFSSILSGLVIMMIIRKINRNLNFGIYSIIMAVILQILSITPYMLYGLSDGLSHLIIFTSLITISAILLSFYQGGKSVYNSTVYELYFSMWSMSFLGILLIENYYGLYDISSLLTVAITILLVSFPAMWISNIYNLGNFRILGDYRSD